MACPIAMYGIDILSGTAQDLTGCPNSTQTHKYV